MRFSISALAVALLAGAQAAMGSPTSLPMTPEGTLIGPLPIDELRAAVAEFQLLGRGLSAGLYLCDGSNFTGNCYWGSYPISTSIHPDSYWVTRIISVGPDKGVLCVFYDRECDGNGGLTRVYPGGDLPSPYRKNLHCFYCIPS